MAGFELSKWYADCVAEDGRALILYSAELRWRGPAVHYSNLLTYAPSAARSRFSLMERPAPVASETDVEWRCGAWKAEGRWRKAALPLREILFDSPEGSLEWHCIAPRARVEVCIGGAEYCGWGYVEHLRLTLRPWTLPIRRLRWGRFVNASDALVWIDWEGPYNRRAVYLNGASVPAERVHEDEVRLENGTQLTLQQPAVLREGKLGSTVLRAIPGVERLFPASARNIVERKWLSDAVLSIPGHPVSRGRAIHEVVEWQ